MTTYIGLYGSKRQGKDTAAGYIAEHLGNQSIDWKCIAFADALRELIIKSLPTGYDTTRALSVHDLSGDSTINRDTVDILYHIGLPIHVNEYDFMDHWVHNFVETLRDMGYQQTKDTPLFTHKVITIRKILEFFGTEVGRECFTETLWTDIAEKKGKDFPGVVVYTDVRFDIEAEMIIKNGGKVYLIKRDMEPNPNAPHASERGIKPEYVHARIMNYNGEFEKFKRDVITTTLTEDCNNVTDL